MYLGKWMTLRRLPRVCASEECILSAHSHLIQNRGCLRTGKARRGVEMSMRVKLRLQGASCACAIDEYQFDRAHPVFAHVLRLGFSESELSGR